MSLQIANPTVIAKVEALAKAAHLTKTAAVEKAVDAMLAARYVEARPQDGWQNFHAILKQIDAVPDQAQPFNAVEWDEEGLPR